jgi:hypothetical protein
MTKQEAKDLSLEIWGCLEAHPNIRYKEDLPQELFAKIENMTLKCPLCEVCLFCEGCPLESCTNFDSAYNLWCIAESDAERQAATAEIVRRIEAWEPKG